MTFCKLNFRIPPAPAYKRRIWQYNNADIVLIQRSMSEFDWENLLLPIANPNVQVSLFENTFLNIMSNFIPNCISKINPKDPPWITTDLKRMINRQNRLYKNYKRHGFRKEDKLRVDNFQKQCNTAVLAEKERYLQNLGTKLAISNTSQKTYWRIINKIMNKCKAPKIPPLLIDNRFVVNCKTKAIEFNNFFVAQCKP